MVDLNVYLPNQTIAKIVNGSLMISVDHELSIRF